MENGVDETPLEIAALQGLLGPPGNRSVQRGRPCGLNILKLLEVGPPLFSVEKLQREIPRLRSTIGGLMERRGLMKNTKLSDELLAFTDAMELYLT